MARLGPTKAMSLQKFMAAEELMRDIISDVDILVNNWELLEDPPLPPIMVGIKDSRETLKEDSRILHNLLGEGILLSTNKVKIRMNLSVESRS